MAAVEHPATSMNGGNVNFTYGSRENNDDAFEAATLQDEVRGFPLTYFELGEYRKTMTKGSFVALFTCTKLKMSVTTGCKNPPSQNCEMHGKYDCKRAQNQCIYVSIYLCVYLCVYFLQNCCVKGLNELLYACKSSSHVLDGRSI